MLLIYVIVLGVFVLVAMLIFSVATGLDERSARARMMRDRLSSLERAQERQASEELALLRDELLSDIPALHQMLGRSQRVRQLQEYLAQADLKIRAGKFLMICAVAGIILGAAGLELGRSALFGLLFGLIGAGLPLYYASLKRTQRFHRFEEMFPEAIELLARAIRAGHAFTTSVELIANELGEPVGGEFRTLFEEQKFGLPVRDALLNLGERMPLVDVKFFVTSVMLQRETGGNLAEILDKLSYVIRERFKIMRQVRVYTAQGRLTMGILMALPPGVVGVMAMMDLQFIRPLWEDPIGHFLIGAGIVMQTIGFFLIRRIIRIQV